MKSKIRLFEVGPRDGLQSEEKIWTLAQKHKLVSTLIDSGLRDIEVGSFVHPKWVPQLRDTEKLVLKLKKQNTKSRLWTFVPNERGLERAIQSGVDGVGFFIAVSKTFCMKNVNRSQAAQFNMLSSLLTKSKQHKLRTRIYVSTAFHCPYEGIVSSRVSKTLVKKILALKPDTTVISDTTGYANPRSVKKICAGLTKSNLKKMALHMHDTRGMALANVLQGLSMGISEFDSSIGGMGGCPYAPAATGNLATEDLVNMLQGMGSLKSISLPKLRKAGLYCEKILQKPLPARILRIGEKRL